MNSKNIQKSDYEVMLREERDIESNTPIKVSEYKLGLIFFIEISVKLWIHAAHRKKVSGPRIKTYEAYSYSRACDFQIRDICKYF